MIGIAITTTPQRQHTFDMCLENIRRTMPDDCVLYIHNDTEGIGVAKSKNNCIAYLMREGCDYLFLFDDDCWSIEKGWEKVFIDSGLHYSCPTFSHWANGLPYIIGKVKYEGQVEIYPNAAGVVLFYTREAINRVGGMNICYGKYGWEHLAHAHRIHNAGLTVAPYLAPKDSFKLFRSLDQEQTVLSTVTNTERKAFIAKTLNVFKQETKMSDWMPFEKMYVVLTFAYGEVIDNAGLHNLVIFNDWSEGDISSQIKSVCSNKGKYSGHFKAFSDMYEYLKKYRYYFDIVYISDNVKVNTPDDWEEWVVEGYINVRTGATIGDARVCYSKLPANIRRQFPQPKGEGDTADCSLIGGKIKDVLLLLEIMVDKMKKCPEIDSYEFFMHHTCVEHIPTKIRWV